MKVTRSSPDKRTRNGEIFDSIAEMEAYSGFVALRQAGKITKLQREPTFVIEVNGQHICRYTPDWTYIDSDNKPHVVDVKGWKKSKRTGKLLPRVNREFGLKCRLLKAVFGLDVEVL